jgi:Tfp pilus assembly PilM family ATPase
MISIFKSRRLTAVLGLAFEHGRIAGVVLRRSGGTLGVQSAFRSALSLDPLTNDSELVGREIRNHLNESGVRVKDCVVSMPLTWALTLQTKIPALPEEEIDSFLSVQAERGFPYAPEDLLISKSRYQTANGDVYGTIVAIPKNHVILLEKALKAAKLRPVSFTLGTPALRRTDDEISAGAAVLAVAEDSVDLQISCGGGIAALRTLEGTFEVESGQRRIYADLAAREIKITLGQLPKELRDTVRKIEVVGRGEITERLAREIRPRIDSMGLTVEWISEYRPGEFGAQLPTHTGVSPALSIAARYLTDNRTELEFLPPKVSSWPQLSSRFSSRRVVLGGATAAVLLLGVIGLFSAQHWKLSRLESEWRAMEPKVRELEGFQQQIRKFNPWFDNSIRSLTIFRKLSEAFPQDGAVSAKTVEIRDQTVICSGVAKDNPSFRRMFDQVRAIKEVTNPKVDQIRGTAPVQFTFNFHWSERGHAN